MFIPILILISSVLFLAGFLNFKFPNSAKKLLLQLKKPFLPSPASPLYPSSSSSSISSQTNTSTNIITKDDGLKKVFETFDKNGDGFITRQELHESLKNIGIYVANKEVEEMVDNLDSNRDGLIDLGEFQELYNLMKGKKNEKGVSDNYNGNGNDDDDDDDDGELKKAFGVFDGDKDGLISVEELRLVLSSMGLNEGNREDACKEMISKVDVDGDGKVNFEEFKKMMKIGYGDSIFDVSTL